MADSWRGKDRLCNHRLTETKKENKGTFESKTSYQDAYHRYKSLCHFFFSDSFKKQVNAKQFKMPSETYDYVIVGGGTAGCVLASRLHHGDPSLSIVVIEAGSDVSKRADVLDGSQWAPLLGTELN
jgi:hypothetical protein